MSTFLERAERYYKLTKLLLAVAKNIDVSSMRSKYNFTKKRVVRIYIIDANKYYTFQLRDDGLKVLLTNPTPDAIIIMEQLCTFKHLRLGKKAGMDPANGAKIMMRYTPWESWRMGDIKSSGDGSTNDFLAAMEMFTEMVGCIPEPDVVSIIGPCEHD